MPLDSDVFRLPPGCNAPQQVHITQGDLEGKAVIVEKSIDMPLQQVDVKVLKDQFAPVYITIGDEGNMEGLATKMTEPQPKYSAYREASFGHAIFSIKNRNAHYGWHRNQDGYAVEADTMWHILLILENLRI
ncbi:hypothetical protein Bca101_009267 [Brassica carinata]